MTQSCDLAQSVEIAFPSNGIRIRPYEVSTREERHKFSHARVKISIQAAELIERSDAYETPVNLYIGGILQSRYYVPNDGLTYTDENEQAWVEMLDPLKLLEEETISGSFNNITLEELVADIFGRKNDPNGVLSGFEVVDEQVAARSEQQMRSRISSRLGGGRFASALGFIGELSARVVALSTNLSFQEGGFEFDDHTLWQALAEVADVFGVIVWCNGNGVMEVGLPEARSVNAIAVHGDPRLDKVSISGFNVGTSRNSVSVMQGRSTTNQYRAAVPISMQWANVPIEQIHFVAEARLPGVEGNRRVLERPIPVRTQEDMEDAIKRKFMDTYMSHNSGNIEFNGISSEDKSTLAQLTVGDYVGVATARNDVCGRNIEGGKFVVNRVLQKVNARVGWQITAEVSRIAPSPDVRSLVYDYQTGEYFESREDVQSGEPVASLAE